MSYDINIVVNGNRCKQYSHNGRTFIEAKEGSEYSIEIKNNTWSRILAVCSVDGLDILNGKAAEEDGPGYVINGYNSSKFDGFRVSDDKVAKFVFDFKSKNNSYAASKNDGSEANVGVIGVRIFSEKYYPPVYCKSVLRTYPSSAEPVIWTDTYTVNNTCNNVESLFLSADSNQPQVKCFNASFNTTELKPRGFDMATKWGESKESKVVEVNFERGLLALTSNIFYASRESLIQMGVPIGNEKQVNFPEPFKNNKYAQPPSNWRG